MQLVLVQLLLSCSLHGAAAPRPRSSFAQTARSHFEKLDHEEVGGSKSHEDFCAGPTNNSRAKQSSLQPWPGTVMRDMPHGCTSYCDRFR